MKAKIFFPIIISIFISIRINAQDFHLTQYDAFSLYLNPALTGSYLGDDWNYKIHALYRTQWKSIINKPYKTYGLGYDKPYRRVGIGGYLLDNCSGSADFNTLNFQLSGAYFITDPETSPHTLNVGVQAGLFYKSFNYNKFLFENQYDYETGQLNSSMSSGESFNRTSRVNFDANVGVFYKYKDWRSKLNPFLGFSVFHVNMPMENFAGTDQRLPMRFNLNGGTDIRINNIWKIVPMALYMNQAQAEELNLGMLAYYTLNRKEGYDLIAGVNYRVKDAVMFQVGMKYSNYILRMSYDVNNSYLSSYSNKRGGYEITLQICGKKSKHMTGAYF